MAAMSQICPKCRGAFENISECPKCRVPLTDLGSRQSDAPPAPFPPGDPYRWGNKAGRRPDEPPASRPPERWHQSPAGRLVAGILLALGLSFGLLQLCKTLLQFMGRTGEGALSPELGLGLFYGLQAPVLVLAGMLAGVGRRRGAGPGLLVGLMAGLAAAALLRSGLLNGVLAPFASNLLHFGKPSNAILIGGVVPLHQLTFYGLPLLYVICATVGGILGSMIWKPAPELALATLVNTGPGPAQVGLKTTIAMPKQDKNQQTLWNGPVAWVQVIAGIGIAIAGGSVATRPVREFALHLIEGHFEVKSNLQDEVTLGEIFAFALLLGGAIAGATKPNGLKQGLIVGVGAGIGMIPFLAGGAQARYMPYIIISSLFISTLGGWFGTTLLPPPPPGRLFKSYD